MGAIYSHTDISHRTNPPEVKAQWLPQTLVFTEFYRSINYSHSSKLSPKANVNHPPPNLAIRGV